MMRKNDILLCDNSQLDNITGDYKNIAYLDLFLIHYALMWKEPDCPLVQFHSPINSLI